MCVNTQTHAVNHLLPAPRAINPRIHQGGGNVADGSGHAALAAQFLPPELQTRSRRSVSAAGGNGGWVCGVHE